MCEKSLTVPEDVAIHIVAEFVKALFFPNRYSIHLIYAKGGFDLRGKSKRQMFCAPYASLRF